MNEWKQYRIKDIASISSGTTPNTSREDYYVNGVHPWLNTGKVQDGFIYEPSTFVTDKALQETSLRYFPINTLLLAMYGGGTIGNVGLMTFPSTINQACCALELYKKVSPKFVFYALLSKKKWIISRGFGGTQVNLNQGQVSRFDLLLPPLAEQNRIVAYLDEKTAAIDKQVSLLEQKKEKYTLLRKSIIKKAVTEGLKGETRDWKRMRGKDVYKISTGNLDANAEDENGTYPFFTCSSLPKRINKYSFDCEALLVAGNGQIGYTQYYNGKFDAYQRTYVLHNFKEISPLFLKYYVASMLPIFVAPRSVGSVISFIKYGDLAEFPIPVPPLFEQRAIADYLDEKCAKIDAIVANINQQIEKYKLLRRALINEVVTGQKII